MAAVHYKAVVLRMKIHCWLLLIIAPIVLRIEDRTSCFYFIGFWCHVNVGIMYLFLAVPWVDLQCVIMVFPGHTHLRFICSD